jgi:type IV conjugative transfer system protein TraL
MADKYLVPQRLDDPELIGFWTIDEFAGLLIPFAWGILAQHIFIGIALALRPGSSCGRRNPETRARRWCMLPTGTCPGVSSG